ncbi:MAG: hypothetical protein AB7S83_06025 [Candidatus Methanomethylophilaceae archaeon]|jgi:uncharacterized membrane protein
MSKGFLGGMFRSSKVGMHYITGNRRCAETKFIMLELSDGRLVAFNLESGEETETAYRDITSRVAARRAPITKGPPGRMEKMTDRDRKIRTSALLASLALSITVPASVLIIDVEVGVASVVALVSVFLIPAAVMILYLIWHIRCLPWDDMGKAVLAS